MAHKPLFSEFEATDKTTWLSKIEKDLKGKNLEELASSTSDGIAINPVYFAEDAQVKHQPLKQHPKWDTVQEILVENEKAANKTALDHLNRGATSLLFYVDGNVDLKELLHGIEIQYICLNIVTANNAIGLAKKLNKLIAERGLKSVEIEGSLNFDPLENLARTGNWFEDEAKDFIELAEVQNLLKQGVKSVCVNANLFGNAGATAAQQLGITLAMSYEYIYQLKLENTRGFWLNLAIGGNYFEEIAKFRALRRLWQQLQNELRMEPIELRLYAETGTRNKTIFDRHNNMIRTTAEAMAAAIGGANEIAVKGFDHTYQEPTFFGERIAKNQQSILQHESHLHKVRDMAQGSYFIENLTEELAVKGWAYFKTIEQKGGYLKALASGWLQDQIENAAQVEQTAFNREEKVLIGANKFKNANEDLKSFAAKATFSQAPEGQTEVWPVVPIRVSEKLEQETLKAK